MNKKIKFRVFCEKHNRWEYYSLGDLVCGAATENSGEGGIFKSKTWSQFIDLHDKNGKEIYEGDILKANIRNKNMLFEVHYNVNRCMWEAKHKEIGETMALQNIFFRHSETEVIGNLHDNPELLT
jgi:uncharacterized phage protein (TIGR01671 family)